MAVTPAALLLNTKRLVKLVVVVTLLVVVLKNNWRVFVVTVVCRLTRVKEIGAVSDTPVALGAIEPMLIYGLKVPAVVLVIKIR